MEQENLKVLTRIDIVTYALYLLGGWQERIHTEDITLKCFELAPSKFSWVKYPKYPDMQPVRFALEKSTHLITGRSERKGISKKKTEVGKDAFGGWRLTPEGINWIKTNQDRIKKALGKNIAPDNRLHEGRKLKDLINSQAYAKYLANGSLANYSHAELAESLNCTVNADSYILLERIGQLNSLAKALNQKSVLKYLSFCTKWFKSYFKGA